ncbi:MAG: hypothetical protein KAT23_06000 [Anaerolineales bacterium]|nr:hypothetical protein [Anaerolineales bacterium]
MDLGSILIILTLVLLTVTFITRPLIEQKVVCGIEEDHRLSTLQVERDRLLDALQELDMDHAMGKVLLDDYQMQRGVLLARGVNILKAMDGLDVAVDEPSREKDLKASLETTAARLRHDQRELSGEICGACGEPVFKSDRFCSSCGKSLKENTEA